MSQSGKTSLAMHFLQQLDNWVIIDTKREDFAAWSPTEDPADILRRSRCVFQPPRANLDRPAKDWSDPWSLALHYIWSFRAPERPRSPNAPPRHAVTVVFDEAKIAASRNCHPIVKDIAVSGMGRGVGLWALMQGAHGVAGDIIDNAVASCVFRIHNAAQRGILSSNLNAAAGGRLGKLNDHDFMYWRQGMGDFSGPFNLRTLKAKKGRRT